MEALFPYFGRPLEADTVGCHFIPSVCLSMAIYRVKFNVEMKTHDNWYYVFDIYISSCGCDLQLYYRKISILTSSGVFTFLVSSCYTVMKDLRCHVFSILPIK